MARRSDFQWRYSKGLRLTLQDSTRSRAVEVESIEEVRASVASPAAKETPAKKSNPVVECAWHMLAGALIFALLGCAAAVVHLTIEGLTWLGVNKLYLAFLYVIEGIVLFVDAVLLVSISISTGIAMVREAFRKPGNKK